MMGVKMNYSTPFSESAVPGVPPEFPEVPPEYFKKFRGYPRNSESLDFSLRNGIPGVPPEFFDFLDFSL